MIIISLIGRTNVGKSTLFNKLIGNRNDALVSNDSSLTRDRKYGYFVADKTKIILVDTPGINIFQKNSIFLYSKMFEQTNIAIQEADIICFVVNAREKLMYEDIEILKILRKKEKNIVLLINKIDGLNLDDFKNDFFSLGLKNIYYISATNGIGIDFFIKNLVFLCRTLNKTLNKFQTKINVINSMVNQPYQKLDQLTKCIKVAIIGKPNVGKSTLINTLLNEKRMIIDSYPGTTRDSVCNFIRYKRNNYVFIDTAGIRRKTKIDQNVEKISVYKAFETLRLVNVVLLMIDITCDISDQDLFLFNFIIKNGCTIIVVLNKCDVISTSQKIKIIQSYKLKLMKCSRYFFISAKKKIGLDGLFKAINITFKNSIKKFSTSQLTQILQLAIKKHRPPIHYGNRIKMKYAHIGKYNPFTIIIHGNKLTELSALYKRYLNNFFQRALNIRGVSIFLCFKNSKNPYVKL